MDYENVPTTVFTPLEYGSCGLSEEDAKARWGDSAVVYHQAFKPLEWQVDKTIHEGKRSCYVKVIVNREDSDRVIGFHILAPNAGEVTQGVGIAMKANVTKEQFDSCVGIHPTVAEDVIGLNMTKDDNPDA